MLQAPLSVYDGGIAASAGTFILHGRLPYRDFWLLYGPLAGYLSAALTAIFGPDVTVLRLGGLVVVACTALLGYGLIRDRAPGVPGTLLAVVGAAITVRWTGLDQWSWALALAFVLGSILVARGNTRHRLVVSGFILGLAVLTRQDLGAYGLIAVVVSSRSLRPLAGAALLLIPAGVLLLLAVPIPALFEQLVWYPLVGPREFRGLPGPGLGSILDPGAAVGWLLYWPPLVVIGLALVRLWRSRAIPPTYGALLLLAILCRLQTLGRADAIHSAEAIVPVVLLIGYALPRPRGSVQRIALSVGAAIVIALAALPLTMLGSPGAPYDQALTAAVDVVRSNTQPDEPIFVGEIHNLHTVENPLIAYYLADRPPGVRDTMYNPGVTNTVATQSRMVGDLKANHVRFLILDVSFADCFETSNESRIAGPTILDQAIARDYAVVADFGAVEVMGLRGTVAPVVAPQLWVDPRIASGGPLSCTMPSNP